MLSQTAEYALRLVVHLATLNGEPATTKALAAATRVPEGYLAKIVRSLSVAGILRSRRGLHGGSILGRPAEQITIYDVVNTVSPMLRIRTCPLGITSHGSALCPVHRRLDNALQLMEQTFRQSTIAELISESSSSRPLCDPDRPTPVKLNIRKSPNHLTSGRIPTTR